MKPRENEEFTADLKRAVQDAERLGYKPNRFKSMLDERGGFDTVKAILASGKPSDGFTRLWELKRLDLTCEAIVVESRWRPYFDDDLIARAEAQLRAVNYAFERFEPAKTEGPSQTGEKEVQPEPKPEPSDHDDQSIERPQKPVLRINAFFQEVLNAPVANPRWSWGSVDEQKRCVFLRLWRMDLCTLNGRHAIRVLVHKASLTPGWTERRRHLDLIRSGYTAFGVLCDKESQESAVILSFDQDKLLLLGAVIEKDDMTFLEISGPVPVRYAVGMPSSVSIESDLLELQDLEIPETTRRALVDARLGQGAFRRNLMREWDGSCAVTGCRVNAVLRASHCKPWRSSDNSERLDSSNGLLLQANLDALFDAGLISFDDDGRMLVANLLTLDARRELSLPTNLRKVPSARLREFLGYHREKIFVDGVG